ncbi:hypothetical protein BC830DRAFT_239945 [Chytriomyces sp. MP71]|nr:hypothetical protein BC830DRAFT_239945 [Chytriomyces sp. MP71]
MELDTEVVPTEESVDGPGTVSCLAVASIEIAATAALDSFKHRLDATDEVSDPDMKRPRASSIELEVDLPSDLDGMEGEDVFGLDALDAPISCPYSGCAAILTSRKKLRSHKYVRHAKTCPLTFKNGERFTLTRDSSGFMNCPFCAYGSLDVSNIQRHGRTRKCNQTNLSQGSIFENGDQLGEGLGAERVSGGGGIVIL